MSEMDMMVKKQILINCLEMEIDLLRKVIEDKGEYQVVSDIKNLVLNRKKKAEKELL